MSVAGAREPGARQSRLTIGLAVYNGEPYVEEAIGSFLSQSFQDFELRLADNASSDRTPAICRAAAARDDRIRFMPSDVNGGLAWNHNRVAAGVTTEYFMWAPHDDRFAPRYLERCIDVLDSDPAVVYCYGETVLTNADGTFIGREVSRYNFDLESPNARLWEQLTVRGGQNFYGIMRTSGLRRIAPHRTFPWAERVIFCELSLYGEFRMVKGPMYLRRIHPGQLSAARANRTHESVVLDPRRKTWWRHNRILMNAEYFAAFVDAVRRAPLPAAERARCYGRIGRWVLSKLPRLGLRDPRTRALEIDTSIAGDPRWTCETT